MENNTDAVDLDNLLLVTRDAIAADHPNAASLIAQCDELLPPIRVIVACPTPLSTRVRKRRVFEPSASRVQEIGRKARYSGRWQYDVEHGGSVANKYGYRATTECAVIAASPNGVVAIWYGAAPANKVTYRGAAVAATGLGAVGWIWDNRCGAAKTEAGKVALRGLLCEVAMAAAA